MSSYITLRFGKSGKYPSLLYITGAKMTAVLITPTV